MKFLLVIAVALLSLVAADHGFGSCKQIPGQSTFDVGSYVGRWYEIVRQKVVFEEGLSCVNAIYSPGSNGAIAVNNSGREGSVTGKYKSAIGEARIFNSSAPADLSVRFSQYSPWAPYHIVSTDYKTFALIYSCDNFLGVGHVEDAWVLSRTPTLSSTIVDKLMNILDSYGVDITDFKKTQQVGCTY